MTHEVAGKPQHLSDIVPDDIFVGTSLILRQGGRFLYGIRPPRAEGSRQIMGYLLLVLLQRCLVRDILAGSVKG